MNLSRRRFLPILIAGFTLGAASWGQLIVISAARAAEPIGARDVARLAASGVDSLLNGKTPAPATQHFFTAWDNSTHTFTRNSDCVAARLDLTCFSVANSANADGTGGDRGCVTLVTALHGVTNHHFGQPYQVGVVHYFVDRANTVYPRRVVKAEQVGAIDLEVVTFDSPLPASIRPAQLFPAKAVAHLLPAGTPLLATNQHKDVVITELAGMTPTDVVVRPALAPSRRLWTASPPAVLGDSDSPTFVILDQRPLLLFTYYTNVSGPALSENLPGIKACLSRGYSLDVAQFQ